MRYEPTTLKAPTGIFTLAGTIPAYLGDMLFETRAIADLALQEAREVLTGKGSGRFAEIWTRVQPSRRIRVTEEMIEGGAQ